MGRPKKAPEERRGDQLNPRLTTAERVEIERNAAILGISPSDFMRRRSLDYRLPVALAVQRHVAACAVALLGLVVTSVPKVTLRKGHYINGLRHPSWAQAIEISKNSAFAESCGRERRRLSTQVLDLQLPPQPGEVVGRHRVGRLGLS
jgi:hypothetical protein